MTKTILASALLLALTGCAYESYTANQNCTQQAGCTSSFPTTGYGPVHAQAVAPDSPSRLQPQD